MADNIKIVTDSSSDLRLSEGFVTAPMKITTTEREYVDNEVLDIESMVNELKNYNGRSTTSCPNTDDWLRSFNDAENVLCITITSALSGSYNAAMLAKSTYEKEHPERHVFVLDSLSAGPEMALIAQMAQSLISNGADFERVCREAVEYSKSTSLLFMLESMTNLVNNGRVSPIAAKMAGLLGIRIVGKASDEGKLDSLNKCRGEKRAIEELFAQMKSMGYVGGKVRISHCLNAKAAHELEGLIKAEFAAAEPEICVCGALCSFYAEKHGILVGFEHA